VLGIMRLVALVPAALLVAGAALVALAVISGSATVGLAVIVPFVIGRSLDFALGVLLILAGFLVLPLAFGAGDEEPSGVEGPAGASWGGGGIVVVGPVPFFFGSWRSLSARTRLIIAVAIAAIFVLIVLSVVFVLA
jgi:uncharacterized membrane protein